MRWQGLGVALVLAAIFAVSEGQIACDQLALSKKLVCSQPTQVAVCEHLVKLHSKTCPERVEPIELLQESDALTAGFGPFLKKAREQTQKALLATKKAEEKRAKANEKRVKANEKRA